MPSGAVRNMVSGQIPGDYVNVPLDNAVGHCPDAMNIKQVEPLSSHNGVLYIIPHAFIKLPLNGGGTTRCVSNPVEDSDVTTHSSTVLRRSTQLPLDESFDIIAKFRLAQEDFFLGFELGNRTCGGLVLPQATISMWMSPERPITAMAGNVSITFTPEFKYIYYFPESQPCLFRGNANEVGEAVAVPSRSSSPTPTFSPSMTPFPQITSPGVATPAAPSSPSPPPTIFSVPTVAPPTNEPVCFPAGGKVETETGQKLRMDTLQVGERVLVDAQHSVRGVVRAFSEVFAFTHSDAGAVHAFTQLTTETNLTVELTPGHYIYANKKAVPAGAVREGDWLMDGVEGRMARVKKVRTVVRRGLYNPQTFHGNLVVDGVVATTYSSAFYDMGAAHALLAPVRFLQQLLAPPGFVEEVRCRLGIGT